MRPTDKNIERLIKNLDNRASDELREKVFAKVSGRLAQRAGFNMWRAIMNSRTTKLAVAAVVIVVLGGISFWSDGSKNGEWWLGPPAAWGQEIIEELDNIETLIYRQQVMSIADNGKTRMSKGWERRFNAKDRYRRDRYDDGINVMNTQWVVPDGNDIKMTEVSFTYECYFEEAGEAYGFITNPIDEMRSYVKLMDKASRILDTEIYEGRECVGFEIDFGKFGDSTKDKNLCVWFDVETKLPVRIERTSFRQGSNRTYIIVHDQFEYYVEMPINIFTPQIPEGFIYAHPDDVRDAENK